jgi:hypothetical protein
MPELKHGEEGLRTDLNGHLWRGKTRAIALKMITGQEKVKINLSEIVDVCAKSNGPCDHGHLTRARFISICRSVLSRSRQRRSVTSRVKQLQSASITPT